MSVFEDIKVNDKVIIRRKVQVGWSTEKHFWVVCPVDRVTPKQFVAGGVKYRKDDGVQIGGYGTAFKIGEKENQGVEFTRYQYVVGKSHDITRLVDKGFDFEVMTMADADALLEILKRCTKYQ